MMKKSLAGVVGVSAFVLSYYMYYGIARNPADSFSGGKVVSLEEFVRASGAHITFDLAMKKDESGRTIIRGVISNQTRGYILERLSINVRIGNTLHCDNDPDNPFSKYDSPECKGIRNADVEQTLHEAVYQCYQGNLAFGETAECYTPVAYSIDRTSSWHWDFDVHSQYIRPEDPLGIFDHRRQ